MHTYMHACMHAHIHTYLPTYIHGNKQGPSFAVLNAKPNRLQLVLGEKAPTQRKAQVLILKRQLPMNVCML